MKARARRAVRTDGPAIPKASVLGDRTMTAMAMATNGATIPAPMLKGAIPVGTEPIASVNSPSVAPSCADKIAPSCCHAKRSPSAAIATSHTIPAIKRREIRLLATITPAGASAIARGVHNPMTATADNGTRNQPRVRAEVSLRTDR
jgi:hypothetical protein